jgi:poly-gamma-glutamate synthesis protein (capsule biosynthesis protein)
VRRTVVAATVAIAVIVLAFGVAELVDSTGAGTPTIASPASVTAPSSVATLVTTTTSRPRRGNGEAVTFAFGGDVHFEGSIRADLDADPTGMFGPIAPELSAADVAMVNLETAITERGSPVPKSYNFRAPSRAFDALHTAGVDVVTMANNHGVDYGPQGLQDTLAAKAAAPLGVVGIGANASEAYRPWTAVVRGQRIAVIGASDVIDDALIGSWTATDTQGGIASAKDANEARLLDALRAARSTADTLVVYLHWGVEGSSCPTPRQEQLAQAVVGAGADIVVGSHTHRVETAGRLGPALVDYGLGNFVFYNESGPSGVTGVLDVTATGRDIDGYTWKPARIQGGIPHLLSGSAAAQDLTGFAGRRACTNLTP